MKILAFTAGAANMYCGSCLRDNALASELISRGHHVTLLPVYTPTLTDEPNVSQEKVFFGGISVYLAQYVPLFRKSPQWLDRLWDWKPMLQLASRRSISTSPKMLGELTVSMLKGEAGFQQKEIAKLLDWLKHEGSTDLVSLPYSLLIGLARPIKEALDRPICCTLQGEDLFLEGLHEPYKSEALDLIRANVKHVDTFIAVSEYYAEFMPGYLGIPREKIRVVFSEETFPPQMLKVLKDEGGVKVYIITHIASGDYTADKFEREMQRNVDTMIRALVTEA